MNSPADETPPDPGRVLTEASLRTAEQLDLNDADFARIIGISPSSVSLLMSGAKTIDPRSEEGEKAILLVRLYRSLDLLVNGDREQRSVWMGSHNQAFNAVPREFVQSHQGLVIAVNYLDGLCAAS